MAIIKKLKKLHDLRLKTKIRNTLI